MVAQSERNGRRIWTEKRLQTWMNAFLTGERIVVLANREPFMHDRTADGRIVPRRSGSGLVTALEPIVQACSGVWVAHGSGTADRLVVDRKNGIAVPPTNPQYRLRRVWLDDRERRGYYYGFANEALWPLCHGVYVRPVFRADDFTSYGS
jgi:trehalose 6-phosphate synthase